MGKKKAADGKKVGLPNTCWEKIPTKQALCHAILYSILTI